LRTSPAVQHQRAVRLLDHPSPSDWHEPGPGTGMLASAPVGALDDLDVDPAHRAVDRDIV
jgi:hypothetical protein